jgi:hypothetical protein
MAIKFANNASAQLASGINNAVTALSVTTGNGNLFPTLAAGEYFYATLVDASNNIEVVKVTARSGDNFTIVRGQEGTTARSYTAGDRLRSSCHRWRFGCYPTGSNRRRYYCNQQRPRVRNRFVRKQHGKHF